MSVADRLRWDAVYAQHHDGGAEPGAPADFRAFEQHFPTAGRALDVACGAGGAAVWLARRGLQVHAVDISATAIGLAEQRAERWRVSHRCRVEVADLDHGLPPGPPVNVVICHRFRAPHLNAGIVDRLAVGGLLAISVLSEADRGPGRYRAAPGELPAAFADLEPIASGERNGIGWLLAHKR